jgi:formylglycine-generating enzyme required for sulfatase activity
MTDPHPLKVFLCHASADKPAVRKLYRYLRQRGVNPWLDEIDILPGQDWQMEIPSAIFSSNIIVVCLSKNSVDKEGYVQKEITYALDKAMEKPEGTIFIIPAKLEECSVPNRLSRFQWVDLSRSEGHKRLMQSLNLRATSLGPEVSQAKVTDESSPRLSKPESVKIERENPIGKPPVSQPESPVGHIDSLFQPSLGERSKPTRKSNVQEIGIIGIILIAMFLGGMGINYAINNWPTIALPTPIFQPSMNVATNTSESITAAVTSAPPILTKTPKPPTPTFTPGIGSTMVSEKDGMMLIFVPAGEFTMGSDLYSDEQPIHKVTLDSYWIDQTEVTNKMYALCEQAGACQPPSSTNSSTRNDYYGVSEFDDYPVIYVDRNKAKTYCEWAGRRLPTEAEWEKAARGTDGRIYPWGNDAPNSNLLNYNKNVGDTTEVGKYPAGASIYGALDMAGNVWEWVSSLYQSYPYSASDGRENLNATGSRVLRGGAWYDLNSGVRSATRLEFTSNSFGYFGFRCVISQ